MHACNATDAPVATATVIIYYGRASRIRFRTHRCVQPTLRRTRRTVAITISFSGEAQKGQLSCMRCETAVAFLARYLIRGRTMTTTRRITKQRPTCTIYILLYIYMYIWTSESTCLVPPSRCVHTPAAAPVGCTHSTTLGASHTHTHKWHIILYTHPEQCQQFARPLSVQARTRLSKTGKLYDRERGSSAALTQQQWQQWQQFP